MNLVERIVAKAAGLTSVRAGQIVTCKVDLAMLHDSSGPRRIQPKLDQIGARLLDPDKVVLITDHFVTEEDSVSRSIQSLTRAWAERHKIKNFHEAQGICHIVLPERGYLRPGMFVVGGDSHSTTGGAFGCFMIGIGATEMAGVLVTGEIWIRVPQAILVRISGKFAIGITAKDFMLKLCSQIGANGANYQAVEYSGDTVATMSMAERMVLCNMSAEISAKVGIIAADKVTLQALNIDNDTEQPGHNSPSDSDEQYEKIIEADVSDLSPQVAKPHSPENSVPVEQLASTPLDQAYIGACTGAKLEDIRMAAQVLHGRSISPKLKLFIAPASVQEAEQAKGEGILDILENAGAKILPTGCGACIGLGEAALGDGKVGISSSARNFQGRMGALSSSTYLASPYTVAASALAGCIADPRPYLNS